MSAHETMPINDLLAGLEAAGETTRLRLLAPLRKPS